MSKTAQLPCSLPGGEMLPHMSARRRHEICDVVFEMIGGVPRLAAEAEKSSESYWEFMKLWSKGLPKVASTEHSVTEGVESLLDKLDAAERAKTIEGAYEVVSGARVSGAD